MEHLEIMKDQKTAWMMDMNLGQSMDHCLVVMLACYLATQTETHSDDMSEKYSALSSVYYLAANWDMMMDFD